MNFRIASLTVLAVTSLLAGCSSGATPEEGTDTGAVITTRCGPPQGTEAMRAQSRCVEPTELAQAKTIVTVKPGETGGFTYELSAVFGNDKIAFLFPEKNYTSRVAAEEGVAALLRAALNANAIVVEDADREHQSVVVKARNGAVLAISTLFKRHERAAVVTAVQKALATTDVSLISENYRARWSFDLDKRSVSLVAGNGQRMLETPRIADGLTAVDDATFFLHEVVAADYAAAQTASAAEICWQVGVVDPTTHEDLPVRITKSISLAQQRDGSFTVLVKDGDRLLATGTRPAADCSSGIEAARTLTRLLNTMPRG